MELIHLILNTWFSAISWLIIILFVMEKLFWINIKSLFSKDKTSFTFKDLQDHPFFNSIKNSLDNLERWGWLDIENKYKRYWAQKFVPIKFKYFYDQAKCRVSKIENEKDCLQFSKYMSNNLFSMVNEYCKIAIDAWVPEIFVNSFEKYHKWTEDTLCYTFRDITNSRLYYNDIDRVKDILLALEFALMRVYHDLENMFNTMNWKLSGPLEIDAKKRNLIIKD